MTQKGTVGTRSHRTSATMKENSGVSWQHWRAAPRAPNQTGPAWSVWGAVITARDQRVTLPGATAMCSPPCAPTQHVRSIRARTDNHTGKGIEQPESMNGIDRVKADTTH